MHIALIGISNIGKSHWARRLATEAGFMRISCDELIEEALAPELTKLGYKGIHEVAAWMGQPYDARYRETSVIYRELEKTLMNYTTDLLMSRSPSEPVVIDTTGSVIYCGEPVIANLRAHARTIYFEASEDHAEELFKTYILHPKPVIWDQMFQPHINEDPQEALRRCYPQLLRDRALRYQAMADVTLNFAAHKDKDASLDLILKAP